MILHCLVQPLSESSARQKPTVHRQGDSRDHARLLTEQEEHDVRDVVRLCQPAQRNGLFHLLDPLRGPSLQGELCEHYRDITAGALVERLVEGEQLTANRQTIEGGHSR